MIQKGLLVLAACVVAVGAVSYWYVSRLMEGSPPVTLAEETYRRINSGQIVGYKEPNGTLGWRGIPFATPPVGELRWKAPRAPQPWEGVRNALNFGSACPQRGFGGGTSGITGEEDCLYLNVWQPPGLRTPRPVMFWIHGGANHIGEAATPLYHGANLAATHDVVVVSINYRLGPLGWLTHPGLRVSGDLADDSGNYGTLDILRALEWVQENIAQFNGDPDNVTIFGESAGGFNVLTMMVSSLAAELYHKAIVQSGGLTINSFSVAENFRDDEEPGSNSSSRELVNRLMVADGRAANRQEAKAIQLSMTDTDVAKVLRSAAPSQLLSAQGGGMMGGTPYIFGDGYVLPADAQADEIFTDVSNYNVTPVILGTNRDEVKLFLAMSPSVTNRFFGIPYRIRDSVSYNRDAAYGTDAWKLRAVDELAERLHDTQGHSVFAYRFDWDDLRNVLSLDLGSLFGAAHAFEIPFMFGNFDLIDRTMVIAGEAKPARNALSASMMSYWANFAYTGSPGRGRDGHEIEWTGWKNGDAENERLLIFDSHTDGGIRMSPLRLTREGMRERVLNDTSFTDQAAHCRTYRQLFSDDDFRQNEYATLGKAGCND